MSRGHIRLAIALAVGLTPHLASAQYEVRQTPATEAPNVELLQCLRVQPIIENVITAAMARAEAARLSNSPTEMRAALDHLEAALRDIRAQSAPCAMAAATSDPHAAHTMSGSQAPATTSPAQPAAATSDPHAGHATSDAADPHAGHAGHSAAQPGDNKGDRQIDPVNGLMVDPATAPKTTYQGQTYYFSSEQSRKEFLENPAKFAKKPQG